MIREFVAPLLLTLACDGVQCPVPGEPDFGGVEARYHCPVHWGVDDLLILLQRDAIRLNLSYHTADQTPCGAFGCLEGDQVWIAETAPFLMCREAGHQYLHAYMRYRFGDQDRDHRDRAFWDLLRQVCAGLACSDL